MKHLPIFLLIGSLYALPVQTAAQDQFYTICVGTFLNARLADFDNIREFGFLYDEPYENTLVKVNLGGFHDQKQAKSVLDKVRAKGYQDAYIVSRQPDKDGSGWFIQIGLADGKDKNIWSSYNHITPLYVHLDKDKLKVLTGPFREKSAADGQLKSLRTAGFTDAFVKSLPLTEVTAITDFETGGIPNQQETASKSSDPSPQDDSASNPAENPDVKQPDLLLYSFQGNTSIPTEADQSKETQPSQPDNHSSAEKPAPRPSSILNPREVPAIAGNIQRQSVRNLQTILQNIGTYEDLIDGYYGPATTKAYEKALESNAQLKKYRILSQYMAPEIQTPAFSALEHTLFTLGNNPEVAQSDLASNSTALANGYTAYLNYIESGPSSEVDDLMNSALRQVFSGQKDISFPFDFEATYAYRSLDQLLLHLSYIQKLSNPSAAVPCWLFTKHPAEMQAAYRSSKALPVDYKFEPCDPLLTWPALTLLHTIISDLCPDEVEKELTGDIQKNAELRTQISLTPAPIVPGDTAAINAWHDRMWEMMEGRTSGNQLYEEQLIAFKTIFHQSRILLEDYFMFAGLEMQEASQLALYALHTIVNPYLGYLDQEK